MKFQLGLFSMALLIAEFCAHGQTTFIYDQQSSTDEGPGVYGEGGAIQQIAMPFGQSFTPTFSAVDFIRLNLNDHDPSNDLGAMLYVNLRTNSINGPILSSSFSVTLTNSFIGVVNFLFSNSVPIKPGVVYYFEPIVQSGDQWNILAGEYNYSGGSVFANGLPVVASDLWFREGIVIPEPLSVWLVLLGGGVLLYVRRFR